MSSKLSPAERLLYSAGLVHFTEMGIGFQAPVVSEHIIYDRGYFEEYQRRASTEIGEELDAARIHLVSQYNIDPKRLIDIGVGSGSFVQKMDCFGFDINRHAVDMLIERGQYVNPYTTNLSIIYPVSMTFWDSLEHIVDPSVLLSKITGYAFISTPVYLGLRNIIQSKHYKPNEHVWYFTYVGMNNFMKLHGFEFVEANTMETDIGRESIATFVFKRI